MKHNLKLLLFVVVLGLITSGLLLSAKALTDERIQLNEQAELKAAVLDGFDVEYNFTNIHDVFDERVTILNQDQYTFYVDDASGFVSFEFSGNGLWGPIVGILTLEDDFETIYRITILQQEETPGLGGVVAERPYLDTFVGVKMLPFIDITKDEVVEDYQVGQITGATGTSNAFEIILNDNYNMFAQVWLTLHE